MSFSDYKNLGKVVQEFQVKYVEANFVEPLAFSVSDYFREDLQFTQQQGVVDNSEFAICENMVYPVLKEVWKLYHQDFLLWSHEALNSGVKLSGFPEYILARRSPLGKVVFDRPYLLLVEAKQDDFEGGWAQCLAEMIAAQRLNQEPPIQVFGIVSNGATWQFGRLNQAEFTRNILPYSIYELDQLFAAVHYMFRQCRNQLLTYSAA